MSVRATERLIGDVVIASGLSNSPEMVVQSVNIDAKLVTTIWFSDDNAAQQAVFPATALDRIEIPEPAPQKADTGKKGKK
jgi:hypothetical protein